MGKCTNSRLTYCNICDYVIQYSFWFRYDDFDVHADKKCLKKVDPELRKKLMGFKIGNNLNHHPKQMNLEESQKFIDRRLAQICKIRKETSRRSENLSQLVKSSCQKPIVYPA